MAKTIRSPEVATSNWVQRSQAAASFHKSQVDASAWKVYAASNNAEANFATAMQAAIAAKTRQNAIAQSSDEVWKAGVDNLASILVQPTYQPKHPILISCAAPDTPSRQATHNILQVWYQFSHHASHLGL